MRAAPVGGSPAQSGGALGEKADTGRLALMMLVGSQYATITAIK